METRTRPRAPRSAVPLESGRLAQRRYRLAKAEKAEIEVEKLRGSLVELDEVKREHARIALMVRGVLLTLPRRLAGWLATETDRHAIEDRLDREMRDALAEMCKGLDDEGN